MHYHVCVPGLTKSFVSAPQKKFLVPADLTIGQFMYVIRKRIKLAPEQAIFLFVAAGTLPPSQATLQTIYDKYHNEDGFLYMTCESACRERQALCMPNPAPSPMIPLFL